MANPTLLSRLLCADADKNTIPDTDAGTAGVFSQQYGWQAINSLPLSAGGKAVQRQDFNGVFNLLGGIAFYAQKGYTFEWDITQDYYANCVVTDPLDGNKYNAKNDVAKGGSNPSLDSTNWEIFGSIDISGKANITLDNLDTFHRDIITTSGTFTAPATALYKITAKGGGGGGAGASASAQSHLGVGGAGGGEGGTNVVYISMTAGDTATVVIGAGGNGGASGSAGYNGGSTSVTINGNTYTAGGGGGAGYGDADPTFTAGGIGGTGTMQGCAGGSANKIADPNKAIYGASGGGNGGAIAVLDVVPTTATNGGGGAGGSWSSVVTGGGAGGDGFVWFEYFASI